MPIYKFRCEKCSEEAERLLPMGDRNSPQECECGGSLRRVFTAPSIVVSVSSRERILKTMNKDKSGYTIPTIPSDRPRLEAVLAKGLDQRSNRPVIGRGF